MNKQVKKQTLKVRRHKRIRIKISGTAKRPRLSVFKSNLGMYVQLIDDIAGKTLISVQAKEVKAKTKTDLAAAIGKTLADKAKQAGISQVVFDRGGNRYTGRIKALADGARQGGLEF